MDGYTDEPAGLGVPPFLGVWPRYAAGPYRDPPVYLTIDDLRLAQWKGKIKTGTIDPPTGKTRADLLNSTRSVEEVREILHQTDQLTVICGVQTPGKYLSARPATLSELNKRLKAYPCRKILAGPVVTGGTQIRGGTAAETPETMLQFDEFRTLEPDSYADLQPTALGGAGIITQIPQPRLVEIETGRGCPRPVGCSFCTEPLKHEIQWREPEYIIEEVKAFLTLGATAFRLGKQSCIYSYQHGDEQRLETLLSGLAALRPEVLHIDNANPTMVTEERTRLLVMYLTPGSTAALGVESFDPVVMRLNNLNSTPKAAFEAIRLINRLGSGRGENGCPHFLPGINILLGLQGETPATLDKNFQALQQLLAEGLLVRRINIRQVVPFPGTRLYEEVGNKFLRKNRHYYARWTEKVRHEIDLPMLRRVFPLGTVLRKMRAEVHEGNVTFLRQLGSYPIVVGIHRRLPLGEWFDVRIIDHQLRSLTGEVIS